MLKRFWFTLLVGPLTVMACDGYDWMMRRRDIWTDETGPIVWNCLWIALPFIIMLIVRVRNRACWIAAGLATWAFHGYFTWSEVQRQLDGDQSGANIGYGLLSLIFPVIALVIAYFASLGTNIDESGSSSS